MVSKTDIPDGKHFKKQMLKSCLVEAKPFVKWPGGKRAIIGEIMKSLKPHDGFNGYWEPFIGGGAVFFSISGWVKAGTISDINDELVCAYKSVKHHLPELISLLRHHKAMHSKEYYYLQRNASPECPIERAARMVYLNKTCFNGMQRVNKHGKFNVPMGNYSNPRILEEDVLENAKIALESVDVVHGAFSDVVNPKDGDLIYCDPPYHGGFVDYATGGFLDEDQIHLRNKCLEWMRQGARVVVSNSDTPFIRDIYAGGCFDIRAILAPRRVAAKLDGRKPVSELVISTK